LSVGILNIKQYNFFVCFKHDKLSDIQLCLLKILFGVINKQKIKEIRKAKILNLSFFDFKDK
jgi:hypothetical protein